MSRHAPPWVAFQPLPYSSSSFSRFLDSRRLLSSCSLSSIPFALVMIPLFRRCLLISIVLTLCLTLAFWLELPQTASFRTLQQLFHHPKQPQFRWKDVKQRFPVESVRPLPGGPPQPIPRIQHVFEIETPEQKQEQASRRVAVKQSFLHSWNGYTTHAWLQDRWLRSLESTRMGSVVGRLR